jgi:hypothetical protein
MVAKNGWLCCGSESGHFSAARIDMGQADDKRRPRKEKDAETSSNESPNIEMTEGDGEFTSEGPFGARVAPRPATVGASDEMDAAYDPLASADWSKTISPKTRKIAGSRVNCITLWFPPPPGKTAESATPTPATAAAAAAAAAAAPSPQAYNEPVAVLANNDRTVTVVSLEQFDSGDKVVPLDVITYPDYVNRAVMSPDGSMIVAVLDDPYLYVHTRGRRDDGPVLQDGESSRWELQAMWLLKSQKHDDKAVERGSFAVCFSSSGATLAVGTQYGTISIFDVGSLADPLARPLQTYFRSSRPDTLKGAIRDMAFCPGSGDLLAWTEDRGRVGIMDIRSGYQVRQMLDINEADNNFDVLEVERRSTAQPLRRFLDEALDRLHAEADREREQQQQQQPNQTHGGEREWPSRGRHEAAMDPHELLFLGPLSRSRRSPAARGRVTLHGWDAPSRELLRRAPIGDAGGGGGGGGGGGSSRNMYTAIETLNELRHRVRMDQRGDGPLAGIERARASAAAAAAAASSYPGSIFMSTHGRDLHRLLAYARRDTTAPASPAAAAAAAAHAPLAPPPPRAGADPSAARGGHRLRVPEIEHEVMMGWSGLDETDSDRDREAEGETASSAGRRRRRAAALEADLAYNGSMFHQDQPIFEVPPSPDNTSGLAWSADGSVL